MKKLNELEDTLESQEKKELIDTYNDLYYEDQLNYQRDLFNTKISTDAYLDHTVQNIERTESELVAMDKEVKAKEQTIYTIEQHISDLVKAGITEKDGKYKEYYDTEIKRLSTLMNKMIIDLTGNSSLINETNRLTTISNFQKFDKKTSAE